jgi:hypothetical protein
VVGRQAGRKARRLTSLALPLCDPVAAADALAVAARVGLELAATEALEVPAAELLGLAASGALAVGASNSLELGATLGLVEATTELLGLPDTEADCRGIEGQTSWRQAPCWITLEARASTSGGGCLSIEAWLLLTPACPCHE